MYHFRHIFSGGKPLPHHMFKILKWQKKAFMSSSVNFEYQTMTSIREKLMTILAIDREFSGEFKPKDHLMKFLPQSQADLPVRKMKDSFASVIVPLSTSVELRNKYTTFTGGVRIGRLMEDIDLFAGYVSYKHILIPGIPTNLSAPHIVVTISVSDITFKEPFKVASDLRLSGHVCWVGSSSMEVVVYLDQIVDGKWKPMTKALLLMAARNPLNTGPAIVNAIEAETPEELKLLQGGEERKAKRLQMFNQSLLKKVPSKEELSIIHNLFINTIDSKDFLLGNRHLPPDSKWMQDATLSDLVFCHPEHRNLHNKIFGGFIIRNAVEFSWTIAFLYGHQAPKLIHISDIAFHGPVDVGSLLKMYGGVTYSEGEHIQVFVFAETVSFHNREVRTTTSFNFTYDLGMKCDSLYPLTYLEAMKYIDGRRHYKEFKEYSSKSEEVSCKFQRGILQNCSFLICMYSFVQEEIQLSFFREQFRGSRHCSKLGRQIVVF